METYSIKEKIAIAEYRKMRGREIDRIAFWTGYTQALKDLLEDKPLEYGDSSELEEILKEVRNA